MTRPRLALAAGVVAALALAFFLGRTTAPTRERVVERTSERAKVATSATAETATAAIVVNREIVRWRDRKITRPDGTVEETREVVKADEKRKSDVTVAKSATVRIEEREKVVYRERETSTARPNWAIGAAAGAGLDLRPRYQADVARRIVGGLWLTVGVDVSGRAALAGLRLEF